MPDKRFWGKCKYEKGVMCEMPCRADEEVGRLNAELARLRALCESVLQGVKNEPQTIEICLGIWASENALWNQAAASRAKAEVTEKFEISPFVKRGSEHFQEFDLLVRMLETDEDMWKKVQRAEAWLWDWRKNFGLLGDDMK